MDGVYDVAAAIARTGGTGTLVHVTAADGHTPQVVGARMLVRPDGTLDGTVGGGRFEHEVIGLARGLGADRRPLLRTLHLGAELGMCCGGRMEVLLTPVGPESAWLGALMERLAAGQTTWIRTCLESEGLGDRRLSDTPAAPQGERRFRSAGVVQEDGARILVERVAPAPRLLLFGAGHVSGPTARLAAMLGYRVTVFDDRPDWNSAERFPEAERVLEPYEDVLAELVTGPTDSALVVTRGHDFDQQVVEALIDRELAYLGMIGSDTKVKKARTRLRARGADDGALGRLHAPVGLAIGALTPEEIAVSIAAELVSERRQGSR